MVPPSPTILTDPAALPANLRGATLAIGNFDGVHRGHQALLAQARSLGKPVGVLTFEPHPRRLFRPDDPPFRLTPPALKAERLASAGVDFILALPFDWPFASQTAGAFIDTALKPLAPTHILIGPDFRFGQLRQGGVENLRAAGFNVTSITPLQDAGLPISSSRIRQHLQQGDIAAANALLGWNWEIAGTVQHGDKRGRELGYPTANIGMADTLHPAYGIYASLIRIESEDAWLPSATNIGIRPMFELREGRLETYIFDFDRDIYGATVRVRPVQRLRGEAKFDSLAALIAQMKKDCDTARAILALKAPP